MQDHEIVVKSWGRTIALIKIGSFILKEAKDSFRIFNIISKVGSYLYQIWWQQIYNIYYTFYIIWLSFGLSANGIIIITGNGTETKVSFWSFWYHNMIIISIQNLMSILMTARWWHHKNKSKITTRITNVPLKVVN